MIATEIDGRLAIPLRALPFVTAGAIDGRTLAEVLVADEDPWLYPQLDAFVLDSIGQVRNLSRASFTRMKNEMLAARTGTLEVLRMRIPPGVWVWADQAQALFSSMAYDFLDSTTGTMDCAFGEWSLEPHMDDKERAYIFAEVQNSQQTTEHAGRPRAKRNANGENPSLMPRVQQVAEELRARLKRRPNRREVAARLAATTSMRASTAERQIRSAWWP